MTAVPTLRVCFQQGDQIGRIFAYWEIVYVGHFLKIKEITHILGYFFPMYLLILKKGFGCIWAISTKLILSH
jgi:hypothetical protein